MCTKKEKIDRKKTSKRKSLDICCTLNGLFILNFVSIGYLYLGVTKCKRCRFLRVRESILKRRQPSGSSDGLKPTTESFCLGRGVKCGLARPPAHPEDCWRSMLTLFRPTTHSAKKKKKKERKNLAEGNGGLRGQPATHCRVKLIQRRQPVDQFPVPVVLSCLSNSWPGISHSTAPQPPTPHSAPKTLS